MQDSGDADNELTLETIDLPRGGIVVSTCIGPIQLGMPPETIKDSMKLGLPIPRHYIVPCEPFTKTLGANMGVNVAEFEFPAYCNFFFKRQCINLIVTSSNVEQRIRQVFQETLFGPANIDLEGDFPHSTPPEQYPNLQKELEYFRKFGDTLIDVDMLLKFTHFNSDNIAEINAPEGTICIRKNDGSFTIHEKESKKETTIPDIVELPVPPPLDQSHDSFYPPAFGVTVLGNSHGFDPHGNTSGYVLWINHRGIMIDPPPFSSSILAANNIPALMIDGVILTHCHADHDAGTFQKILQEGRVALITTNTIYGSFLRKYSALSGFKEEFLARVLDHRLVRINDPTTIRGATFRFFYSLHSIPCVGFEVSYGEKTIVFSGDHLNDREKISMLYAEGILTQHRYHELCNFPWHGDVILHEAGVPPIHTPLKTLMNLSPDIRSRLYVVHTAQKDVPIDSGLRGAPEGVHSTIICETKLPENAGALEVLDLVRKIDLFSELSLNHAYELLQMAKRVTLPKGSVINQCGDMGDTFYIVIVGEVTAVHPQKLGTSSIKKNDSGARLQGINEVKEDSSMQKSCHDATKSEIKADERKADRNHLIKSDAPIVTYHRKRVSMLSLSQRYISGDYFDLQSLLTPNWILPYQMIAANRVSLLKFNAIDFNWFLRGTSVYGYLQQLATSRLNFSHDLVEANDILRRLTSVQRTRWEILLKACEVVAGEKLWSIGGPCDSAVIIDRGEFKLSGPKTMLSNNDSMYKVGSMRHVVESRSSSFVENKGTNHSAVISSEPSSPLSLQKQRGSGNRIVPLEFTHSTPPSDTLQSSNVIVRRGAFVGDIDQLIARGKGKHATTLECIESGSIFLINKSELKAFLLDYPGILMTLSGKLFVQ